MNRQTFYANIRGPLFGGSLSASQVAGIEAILDEAQKRLSPIFWLAYMLATAHHETARTMQAIREYGRGRGKQYSKPTKHGGQIAYGRGLVQLTWDFNYEKADKELGLGGRLIRNYDLALDQAIAVQIMFQGMEHGWFTGRRLTVVRPNAEGLLVAPYKEWRKIINGTDDDDEIAAIAVKYERALRAAGYTNVGPGVVVTKPVEPVIKPAIVVSPGPNQPEPVPAPAPPAPAAPKPGFWSSILSNWKKLS